MPTTGERSRGKRAWQLIGGGESEKGPPPQFKAFIWFWGLAEPDESRARFPRIIKIHAASARLFMRLPDAGKARSNGPGPPSPTTLKTKKSGRTVSITLIHLGYIGTRRSNTPTLFKKKARCCYEQHRAWSHARDRKTVQRYKNHATATHEHRNRSPTDNEVRIATVRTPGVSIRRHTRKAI